MKRISIFVTAALLLAGCAGQMQGVVRGSGERILIDYEQGLDSDTLKAVVNGENFAGRAVSKESSATLGTGFGTAIGGGDFFTSSGQVFSQTASSNFVAVMLGNMGSTMRCDLRYADAFGETSSGGVGVCNHSDGRVIDILW